MSGNEFVDLLVIGGGINGAGIARDAAGRGLSVLLCEQDDLGGATSSASTKLIHGGLRYLEHREFRLVREALAEREVLLGAAPHIIWPMRFVLPHAKGLRPAWLVRLGLFLYDHLGGRGRLPGSHAIALSGHPAGEPLDPGLRKGFVYSDCWVDDSRLVVLNALDATGRGAEILPRTRCTEARRTADGWQATLKPTGRFGARRAVRARALVNAGGPWVLHVLDGVLGMRTDRGVRLVKGSHIVVPRLYDGDHAYILQNTDHRIVFVIPYEGAYSLIGTTEVEYDDDPGNAEVSSEEIAYLCRAVNRYFRRPVAADRVVWSYVGVRPLYDDAAGDASLVTRDYVLDVDMDGGKWPLLSVFGGKITTYRRLAEKVLETLRPAFPKMGKSWTAAAPLPGGDLAGGRFEDLVDDLAGACPGLARPFLHGLARRHGTLARRLLDGVGTVQDLGADFGAGLFAREVDYLMENEWAQTAEDVLWRRTKAGLHLDATARAAVQAYMDARTG